MSAFKFSPDSMFCGFDCLSVATLCPRTEVVLAMLLTNFSFELTDEPLDAPIGALADALRAADVPADRFELYRHGQTRVLE